MSFKSLRNLNSVFEKRKFLKHASGGRCLDKKKTVTSHILNQFIYFHAAIRKLQKCELINLTVGKQANMNQHDTPIDKNHLT